MKTCMFIGTFIGTRQRRSRRSSCPTRLRRHTSIKDVVAQTFPNSLDGEILTETTEEKLARVFQILLDGLISTVAMSAQFRSLSEVERRTLTQKSSLIVVAVTDAEMGLIVDGRKRKSIKGSVPDVAKVSDSIVGRIINARVSQVVKMDGSIRKGEIVKIFLPGMMEAENEGTPLVHHKRPFFFCPESTRRITDSRMWKFSCHRRNLPQCSLSIHPIYISSLAERTACCRRLQPRWRWSKKTFVPQRTAPENVSLFLHPRLRITFLLPARAAMQGLKSLSGQGCGDKLRALGRDL